MALVELAVAVVVSAGLIVLSIALAFLTRLSLREAVHSPRPPASSKTERSTAGPPETGS